MSVSDLEGYEYPIDQIQPLFDLLKKWDLECLSKTLIGKLTFFYIYHNIGLLFVLTIVFFNK